MKIIDAHHHAWKYNAKDYNWITEEMDVIKQDFLSSELESTFVAHQVDGSVLVQAQQTEEETLFMLDLAASSKFIKGVVGWVDLQSEILEDRLAYFNQYDKLKGFRHVLQSEPDPNYMLNDNFKRGIKSLHNYNYTYDILIFPHQLKPAIKLVSEFPKQKFVLDHIAKPYIKDGRIENWSTDIKELAKFSNVYCKVSGMVTEADWINWGYEDFIPYLDLVFDSFGTDRIMFGSDYPVCLLAASYGDVLGIVSRYIKQFNQDDQRKIFRENAIKFYNL